MKRSQAMGYARYLFKAHWPFDDTHWDYFRDEMRGEHDCFVIIAEAESYVDLEEAVAA
jgi:hypothetical protein